MEGNTALKIEENQEFEIIRSEGLDVLTEAQRLAASVVDDASYVSAGEHRKMWNKAMNQAIEKSETVLSPQRKAYQAMMDLKKEAVEPFQKALKLLDIAIGNYKIKKDREAQAERERLAAVQRKQAEDAKLKAAEAADKGGDHRKAEAILNQPIVVPVVNVQGAPKIDGLGVGGYFGVQETEDELDIETLLNGWKEGKIPAQAFLPNMSFLNAQAKLMKDKLNYPGVTVIWKTKNSSGRK